MATGKKEKPGISNCPFFRTMLNVIIIVKDSLGFVKKFIKTIANFVKAGLDVESLSTIATDETTRISKQVKK